MMPPSKISVCTFCLSRVPMMPRHQRRVSFHMCVLCSLPRGSHSWGQGSECPPLPGGTSFTPHTQKPRFWICGSFGSPLCLQVRGKMIGELRVCPHGQFGLQYTPALAFSSIYLLASEAKLPSRLICVILL